MYVAYYVYKRSIADPTSSVYKKSYMLSATVTHSIDSFVALDNVELRGHECGRFCNLHLCD